jgi:hypothetical protein
MESASGQGRRNAGGAKVAKVHRKQKSVPSSPLVARCIHYKKTIASAVALFARSHLRPKPGKIRHYFAENAHYVKPPASFYPSQPGNTQ